MAVFLYDYDKKEWMTLITFRLHIPEIGIKEEIYLKEVVEAAGFWLDSKVDVGNRKDNVSYVYEKPDERNRTIIGKKEVGMFMYDYTRRKWMLLITYKLSVEESAIKWKMPAKDCRVTANPNLDYGER